MRKIINLNSVLAYLKKTNFLCSNFIKKILGFALRFLPPPHVSGLLVPPIFSLGAAFNRGIEHNASDFRNAWLRLQIIAPPPASYCKAL